MKLITTSLLLSVTFFSLAQKKEIKEAEKLINASKFEAAKPFIKAAEANEAKIKPTDKSKLYRLKALAFSGNKDKATLSDYKTAIDAYNKVLSVEKATKSIKYTTEALDGLNKINYAIETKAQNSIGSGAYDEAATLFEYLYSQNAKDTIYLYNTAISQVKAKKYEESLATYQKLLDMGYTDQGVKYIAKNISTGTDEEIQTKADMDALVAKGMYTNPREEEKLSKKGLIAKDMALIYKSQGNEAKAAEYFAIAKQENPKDESITAAEINMYLVKGVEYTKVKDEENAIKYYKKALAINPANADANYNVSAIYLQKDGPLVDKINALNKTKAADSQYQKLRKERKENFTKAIPYMEKYLEANPEDKAYANNLLSIYKLVKSEKVEAFKSKIWFIMR
ncbi:tetratricopeptide repeat protein [Aquimarina agarivorans]|uniref:tetratricopeptide repeat protein n=1 Tax=Aquimarina agarivorans TaxID=980584 RepID=UPI000248EB75|nr:tetratricopeptide repeat protein [Aquimarina agarivorans]